MFGLYKTVLVRSLAILLVLASSLAFSAEDSGDCQLPETVDAETLVQLSLQCNAQLSAAQYEWRAQQALISTAGRLDDPMLSYSVAPDMQGPGEILEFSQTLPWPGKRRLRREAVEAGAEASQYQWQEMQVQLARQVRNGYADWAAIHELLAINERHRALWLEFIAIAETKYAAGRGNKQAVLQANTQLQLLNHEAVKLEAERHVIKAQLNRFLNRAPEAALGKPSAFTLPSVAPSLIEQRRTALDNQPMLRRLDAERQSIAAEAKLARKERYPDFTLMAQNNTMWMDPDQQKMIGVSINIPFDFGKRSGRIDSLAAQETALHWQQRELTNQLHEGISNAQVRWQEALHLLKLHEDELLSLAEETLATAHAEYQSGASNFLELLSAEQSLLDTQQDYENARRDVVQRYADLIASLGLITVANPSTPLPTEAQLQGGPQ